MESSLLRLVCFQHKCQCLCRFNALNLAAVVVCFVGDCRAEYNSFKYLSHHTGRKATKTRPFIHLVNFTFSRCNENRCEVLSDRCIHNSFYQFQTRAKKRLWEIMNRRHQCRTHKIVHSRSWIRRVFFSIPYHCHLKNVFDAWIVRRAAFI